MRIPVFTPLNMLHLRYPAVIAIVMTVTLCPSVPSAQVIPAVRKVSPAKTFVAGDVGYTDFGGDIDPWRFASLAFGRSTSRGSLIARLNYANRFATSGAQVEADAYPRINATTYAYVNVGYSRSDIFPAWRFGGEVFKSLPNAWETSLGFRQLRFSGSPVTLFTGTLGKYAGDYWVSLRPFLRFKPTGASASAGITARKYFADGDHYLGMRASYGTSPSDAITPDQLSRTRSYSADVHGSGGPWLRRVATWSAGYEHEELSPGRFRRSWTGTAGLKLIF